MTTPQRNSHGHVVYGHRFEFLPTADEGNFMSGHGELDARQQAVGGSEYDDF
jgi:hypothetical protein